MHSNQIAQRRMHSLRLTGPPASDPEDVVRRLVAVQSQDYGPAKWSVAQRTASIDDAAMNRLVADGVILRTHVLRPTWHFVLPEDIRWLLELTGPRIQVKNAHRYRELGLDDDALTRGTAAIVRALEGGAHLTRTELGAALERAGVSAEGQRLPYLLMNAELNGVICSGAPRGNQQSYALLEERAPRAKRLPPDEALAELTLRYFTGHGPATAVDFRWWSSLTAAEIKRGLELVASELEREVFDGVPYWSAPSGRHPAPASPTVHLLQAYDEYIVGYSESRHVLDVSGAARSLTGARPVFNGVVLLDTQVAGYWRRRLQRRTAVIEARLLIPFDQARTRALDAAAHKYGAFLGLTAAVETSAA